MPKKQLDEAEKILGVSSSELKNILELCFIFRDEIASERKELCTYIKKKDEFYQSVRKNRTFDKFKDLKVDDSQLVFEYPGEIKAKDEK